MKAITELRKTAWYLVIDEDGTHYTDDEGHMYFSDQLARQVGRELHVMPIKAGGAGLKTVVTGYYAPTTCEGGC